jgi:hypothetical protein
LDATSLGSGVVSSSLTSVGTIATGTWSATTIAVNKGGTGQTSYTDGQLLIGNSTGNTLAKSTLTAGSGISITNGSGSITIAATASGDVTLNGVQTLTNKTLTDPAIIGTILEDVYTITDGAAFEIDPGNGSIQLITLGANRTPKATNFAAGESVTLMVDDGSAYTLTWSDSTFGGSGVVWKTGGGNAPTLNTTGYTVIVLWKVGTQVYGARVGDA